MHSFKQAKHKELQASAALRYLQTSRARHSSGAKRVTHGAAIPAIACPAIIYEVLQNLYLDAMQGRLPEIGKLQLQIQAMQEDRGSAQFQWDEERLRLAASQEQVAQDLANVHAHLQQVQQEHHRIKALPDPARALVLDTKWQLSRSATLLCVLGDPWLPAGLPAGKGTAASAPAMALCS